MEGKRLRSLDIMFLTLAGSAMPAVSAIITSLNPYSSTARLTMPSTRSLGGKPSNGHPSEVAKPMAAGTFASWVISRMSPTRSIATAVVMFTLLSECESVTETTMSTLPTLARTARSAPRALATSPV